MKNSVLIILIFVLMPPLFTACQKEKLPKPTGYLRLDYPKAQYVHFENHCPFTFDMNSEAIIKEKSNCNLEITYPKMKATLYLSYKPVNQNIKLLLKDAQKLTYEHVIKADDILEQPYLNPTKKVYGMFYQVNGNAATNAQFYVTDSTKHFVDCAVYFYAKPHFDSIMPAANYIKNDMQTIIETLRWK
ncbi:gliding motility lipoprotein GldD [Flavobacterium branchiophilum]|uniref:Gliding motility lipoprotein GldD n=2 Tax=Flavobacterium branchiophilum TaxID=55197 RepID=G2Z406_FLABF|nr:gliding motility lipoprotein GldD [Flavobacterium branchiophilum]PDS26709.1 gliding motility lipoprotein GldD [Flavobacterium branchiophilum]CCB68340.1 Gliding motility lipoprotein precursor GldD [Flavobacterium branchiophilum FL-15]